MSGLFSSIEAAFSGFSWTNLLEVAAIAMVLYAALRLLRGTTAMTVIRGMVIVVLALTVFGRTLDSVVLDWLLDNGLAVLFIIVLIVFQPEFRRAFEHVGRAGGLRSRFGGRQRYGELVAAVSEACERLAADAHGALIVVERGTGLEQLAATGVRVGGAPSAELIRSIFQRGIAAARRGAAAARGRGGGGALHRADADRQHGGGGRVGRGAGARPAPGHPPPGRGGHLRGDRRSGGGRFGGERDHFGGVGGRAAARA